MLKGKKIVLGVTAGIAIYKAVALVSKLTQAGADIKVVMTENATKMVAPLLFKELSGNRVATDMWSGNQEFNVEHIGLGEWADLMLVAPCTANMIGKMAAGIADDLLSTTLIAWHKPIIICPAMNCEMLANPTVKRNLDWLTDNGVTVMPAGEGHLACGTSGPGRLPEPEEIAAFLENFFAAAEGDLRGKTILVTAGGTREAIDPVRFIGNRSSGKMGYAIAKDAVLRGAKVILISGPTALPRPAGVEFVPVISTQDMLDAVLKYFDTVDVVIKAAAVADFKPQQKAAQKIKKTGDDTLNIVLDKNPDILKLLGQRKNNQILVGFAAETEHLIENAGAIVRSKNLDMIVANDVSQAGAGFNTDTNIVKFLFPDGKVENLEMMSKEAVGQRILDIVRDKLLQKIL